MNDRVTDIGYPCPRYSNKLSERQELRIQKLAKEMVLFRRLER